jgi:hypothetical protein
VVSNLDKLSSPLSFPLKLLRAQSHNKTEKFDKAFDEYSELLFEEESKEF